MKKALLFSCILCLSIPALAQNRRFNVGLKGGLNYSWLSDNYPPNTQRTSFHLGAVIHVRVHENWRIQSELYFSAQGEGIDNTHKHLRQDHNYLLFPTLMQYRFNKRFFIETGPQIGALMNRHALPFEIESEDPYRDNNTNLFDLSVAVGAGYQFTRRVSAYTRFNQGITNMRRNAIAAKDYNEVLQLGLNYWF